MPTDVIESIGDGRDYPTISAWKAAYDGVNLVAADQRVIGEVYEGTHSDDTLHYFNFPGSSNVDATRYRWLRPAAGENVTTKITNTVQNLFRLREPFFRLGMAGRQWRLEHTGAPTGGKRCVRVDQDGVYVDSIWGYMTGGSNSLNAVFQMSGSGGGYFLNCIAQSTQTAGGAFYGYRVNQTSTLKQVWNCIAYNIYFSETPDQGYGFSMNTAADVRNCIAINSQLADFHQAGTPATFTNCASGDSSATGAASLTGLGQREVWEDPAQDDFTLTKKSASFPTGSPCIDTGADLSGVWPVSALDAVGASHGGGDRPLWDMGPYSFLTLGTDERYSERSRVGGLEVQAVGSGGVLSRRMRVGGLTVAALTSAGIITERTRITGVNPTTGVLP